MNPQKMIYMLINALKGRYRTLYKICHPFYSLRISRLVIIMTHVVYTFLPSCSMNILTALFMWLYFYLLVSSLISFNSVLQFLAYKFSSPWLRFIPKYFILFDAFSKWEVFQVSFWNWSLLVYRNTTDFESWFASCKILLLVLIVLFPPRIFRIFNWWCKFWCMVYVFILKYLQSVSAWIQARKTSVLLESVSWIDKSFLFLGII